MKEHGCLLDYRIELKMNPGKVYKQCLQEFNASFIIHQHSLTKNPFKLDPESPLKYSVVSDTCCGYGQEQIWRGSA